jgi:hypothetical protein
MASRFERDLTTIIASTVQVTKFNVGDQLPFQFVCAENERVTWTCGYLPSKEQALEIRQHLIEHGWIPSKNPDTTITYPGMPKQVVGEIVLNRKQKRMAPGVLNRLVNEKDHRNKLKTKKEQIAKRLEHQPKKTNGEKRTNGDV